MSILTIFSIITICAFAIAFIGFKLFLNESDNFLGVVGGILMTLAIPCLFIFATLELSVMTHPKIYTDSKYDVAQMIEEHNIKVTTIYVDDINDVGTLIMKRSFFGIDEYLAMEKILDENSDEKIKKQ